ncbi:MAG: hypothetical protein GY913_04765 [Proteobacteria bacterium]|nr:hypothetical protein [Pseudomonadota bacterium]
MYRVSAGWPKSLLAAPSDQVATPSLRGLGGTAPCYHDGRSATLAEAIEHSTAGGMGDTSWMGDDDRDALVAFLLTL